jgi:hypothetical protein
LAVLEMTVFPLSVPSPSRNSPPALWLAVLKAKVFPLSVASPYRYSPPP